MMRFLICAVLTVSAVAFLRSNARAVTEYCPSMVYSISPVGATSADGAASFAVELWSFNPRTVNATVKVQTDNGSYSFDIPKTQLRKRLMSVFVGGGTHNEPATVYMSDQVEVRFPRNVHVLHGWVSQSQALDDPFTPWPTYGNYTCQPLAEKTFPAQGFRNAPKIDPSPASPVPGSPAILATAIGPSPAPACTEPFSDVGVIKATQPEFPDDARGIFYPFATLLAVAVDATGKVDEAWVFASSGIRSIDHNSLAAASASTYKGGTALCVGAPGFYFFRAEFSPN